MEPKIFMIGNAHLDPAWLWRWQEGFAEIKATFRSALDRMKEFDGYIFTAAGASYYQWVEENEPAMFEEIRRRVAEGRWVLAGGLVAPAGLQPPLRGILCPPRPLRPAVFPVPVREAGTLRVQCGQLRP